MAKKCCANCVYCHGVHQYFDENGKLTWFDSLPDVRDENGKDISINAYRCVKFSYFGDVITDIHQEDACDDFEDNEICLTNNC